MLTPAPPEVVAQIVAEAERKLKLGTSTALSTQATTSVSVLKMKQFNEISSCDTFFW